MEFTPLTDHIHIRDITKTDFDEKWIKQNKPVLIKGILDETPAKNWSLNRLEKELGHFLVKVFDRQRKNSTSFLLGDHQVPMNHIFSTITFRQFGNSDEKQTISQGNTLS